VTPPVVHAEVVAAAAGRPGASEVGTAPWIRVLQLKQPERADALTARLQRGEAEAIVLAEEIGGIALLIDDADGRRIATERGLPVIGSAGILVPAKRAGLLASVRPALDALLTAGLYLDETVYRLVLGSAGEA
jgi:predicted nucleic acid-binding protein